MPVLSLAPFLRATKFGFLHGHPGTSRWNRLRNSSAGAANAVSQQESDSRYLQIPEPDGDALRLAGEVMLRSARRARRSLSILVMQLHDLPELELVFGCAAADEATDEAITQLTRIAARKGLVVRTAHDTFTLLMPDTSAEALADAIHAGLGTPCCIEFELEGEEILLVPEVMVRAVGATESVGDAYETSCRDIARARRDEKQRRNHLRIERESHTRPMRLRPKPAPDKDMPTFLRPLPPTTAVPTGPR